MSRAAAAPLPQEAFRKLLEARQKAFGLRIEPQALERLATYLSELDLWRRRMNLTGRLTPEELTSHALESLLGEKLIADGAEVVDIGSGAGFPGIPLAVLRPDICVTALEPRGKRAQFLRHIARSVPLENVFVIQGRIEDLSDGTFDTATIRAVGKVPGLLGNGAFLKSGGAVLAWTTDSDLLSGSLVFSLEDVLPVPGARSKAILLYRKRRLQRSR